MGPFVGRQIERVNAHDERLTSLFSLIEEAAVKEVTSVELINNSADPVAQVDQDREDEQALEVWSATSTTPKSVTKADEIAWPAEKPPVTARFSHRKPARSTPEGCSLRLIPIPKLKLDNDTAFYKYTPSPNA
ncbi:hypothetical protein M0R45_013129 [Rubus argutus]|uniref:Uncharacterized protein n=1 Tax=Rubus argutus TaxID=59490 RepID=A0AAW1XIS2_RUBAR